MDKISKQFTKVIVDITLLGRDLGSITGKNNPLISFAGMNIPECVRPIIGYQFNDEGTGTVIYSYGEHKDVTELSPDVLIEVAKLIQNRTTQILKKYSNEK